MYYGLFCEESKNPSVLCFVLVSNSFIRFLSFSSSHVLVFSFAACIVLQAGHTHWLQAIYNQRVDPDRLRFDHEVNNNSSLLSRTSYPDASLVFASPSTSQALNNVMTDDRMFKFAVVRHPWVRFVSAYRDMYLERCHGDRTCLFDQYGVPLYLAITNIATLDEVLEALLSLSWRAMNAHFRPAAISCDVQHTPYNYIADISSIFVFLE